MISSKNTEALNKIIKASRLERDKRQGFWREFINEFRGSKWRVGVGRRRSSNYVYTYATTFMNVLMFEEDSPRYNPNFLQTAMPIADIMSQAVANVWKAVGFMHEARRAAFDSLYSWGIIKIGLSEIDPATVTGTTPWQSGLKPTMRRVSPFDFIWDDTAKTPREWQFCGEEFDRDLESLINDKRYDLSGIDDPRSLYSSNDTKGKSAHAFQDWQKEYRKEMPTMCRLLELYLRTENRIVTLIQTGEEQWDVIRDAPYYGKRQNGPYYILGYAFDGDHSVPVAPAASWWDQWDFLEKQEHELHEQFKQEKTIVAFPKASKTAAEIVKEAKTHSIVVGVDDVGRQVTYGGATEQKLVATQTARQTFEYASGMSDIMRGQASRTEQTATAVTIQDRYSNIRLEAMANAVRRFAMEITDGLLWYCWYDPNVFTQTFYSDPATGEQLAMVMQGGTFIDLETGQPDDMLDLPDFYLSLDADAFGRKDGPLDRVQAIEDANLILGPIAQVAMMQGYMPNAMSIVNKIGKRIGWHNLSNEFIPMTPMAMALMQMSMAGQSNPSAVKGAENSGGSKAPLATMPGGPMGGIMANVMTGSPTMSQSGKVASPMGQASKKSGVKGDKQK